MLQNTYSLRLLAVLSDPKSSTDEYPFPDLVSSGCLEVHTFPSPRVEEIQKSLHSVPSDLVYLQGGQLPNDEVGSVMCGGVELSTVEAVCGLFGATMPTAVYLEIPSGEDIANALHRKGIPNVIYYGGTITHFIACHFRQALLSVLQSSSCHIWDAFMLAYWSFRVYCVQYEEASSPCFIGNPPKIDIRCHETAAGHNDNENCYIEIHDTDVSLKFLVCGLRNELDSGFLQLLASGLSVLLCIEIRGSKLSCRKSELSQPHPEATLSRGVVAMRCHILTTSSAYFQLLVSGSAATCLNEQALANHLKKELIENRQLVNADCEEDALCLLKARRYATVAGGAPVIEVRMKVPKWASEVLRLLARDGSYRSLVALGIACVDGVNVASFEKVDAQRLLFFCNRQENMISASYALAVSYDVETGKKHGCSRSPLEVCSEEEFLEDLMEFLTLRGHSRLIPKGGLSEFPATVLNRKRLDLFGMYKAVVSLGGFRSGNGLNWKRRVFPKMKNHFQTNTGLRGTLRSHYETYLLEYQFAHDDVDGRPCLFCLSEVSGDVIRCRKCRAWAHYGCDRRPKEAKGLLKDFVKGGKEYTCGQCSIASVRKLKQKRKHV